jgi:acyl-CoA synthetase (AMP-forming)/AMP-acid ligase II
MPLQDEPGLGALSIPGYLREVTQRFAGREALVMHGHDGVQRWSYDELWLRSVAVARALLACGVGKDSRVGILMSNRPEYLATLFGTALAGGVSVALSTFSTPSELEYLIGVSGISVLLFEDRVLKKDFSGALAELEPRVLYAETGKLSSLKFPFLQRLVRLESVTGGAEVDAHMREFRAFEGWDAFLARGNEVPAEIVAARAASVAPSDAGGLFFSSGTTSLPKGILHAQRAFAIQWWRWPRVLSVKEPARSWTGNGFFWSANITMVVGTALSTGGAVILQPTFEPEKALQLIEAERVTLLNGRPHQWARFQSAPNWSSVDLSSLRYVTKGELIMAHPTVNTDWQLPMSFGTTETMTINTAYTSDTSPEQYAGSFGEPLPGNILKIVDPQTGAVVPRGQRGEICIKGPTLMIGYIGKPVEETLDDQGYYCTGDGGYVDEAGRLYWEGRLNDIIKTGGANVSPEEVDTAIAACPGVKRTQTVGVPHETLGEMVVACIVPLDGVVLDEKDIIARLKEQLASFKVPRRVLFFREEDFALTGNEKIKAGEIRQLALKRLTATS